jgi:hypothetical protein
MLISSCVIWPTFSSSDIFDSNSSALRAASAFDAGARSMRRKTA